MARKPAAAKTSTIYRTTPVPSSLLEHYCRGLEGWPRSPMGWEKIWAGEKLVAGFRPFLEQMVSSDLSPKTIQKHVENLGLGPNSDIRSPTGTCAVVVSELERLDFYLIQKNRC